MGHTPKPIETGIVVGQVFLGKYRVDAILGHGGMGVVAQCTHLQLQDRVAIKMLRPDVLNDDDAVSRFMREAQAASKLKSEYVAKVTDVGVFENDVPYMVMEYLDGQDLGQLLAERRQLPVPWVAELILQASEALSEAHALGIVHRDVKPTNLFVTWRPDGSALIKVLDFGISKSPMGADMQLTQTQSLLGTPAYMSPEQMRSARMVDLRSDIWSLGTVMYEAIEGRRPFEAESFSEMVVKVAVDPPLAMRNAPLALQPIILRCLAKTPEQRYANMAELGRDLLPFSQDPHGAQIMVERMERMVRRSNGDWSEQSSTGGARIPNMLRDAASRPVRAVVPTPRPQVRLPTPPPVFAADSQVAAQPWAGGTDPQAPALRGSLSSMPTLEQPPHVEPTMRVTAQQPKRNAALIAVLIIAGLAGVAIGIVAATRARRGGDAPVGAGGDQAKPPATVVIPATPAPPTPPPTPTPTPVVKVAAPVPAPAPAPDPTPQVPETHPRPLPAPIHPRAPDAAAPTRPAPTAAPAAMPTPTRPIAKPAPECDPFANPHGCPTSAP